MSRTREVSRSSVAPRERNLQVFTSARRWLAAGSALTVALLGLLPAMPAQAQPLPTKVTVASISRTAKAANWLVANPASTDDGYAYKIYNATGLAALSTSSTAGTLRTRVKELRDGAAAAVAAKPTLAPYLTILADAMHLNPKSFGGVDLVSTIQTSLASESNPYSYAYAQALAIIALKRADATVPASLISDLLSGQTTSGTDAGAFGYSYGGTFYADPDSTALAIQALDLVGKTKYATQVKNAASWAKKNQQSDGSWAAYSPVDSTALMATAFKTVKASTVKSLKLSTSYAKAYKWLKTKQLSSGGFPGATTDADLMATFDASFLLTGKAWSTFSYKLRHFSKLSKPTITGTKTVGSTLTAKLPGWKPGIVASTTVSYRWLRGGKSISGATAATYTLTAADKGKRIQVRVKVSEVGMVKVVKTSKPTKKIGL
jgi:hypothetical protein